MLHKPASDKPDAPEQPQFQRAPTLGGECYKRETTASLGLARRCQFQRAPTLGGECYDVDVQVLDTAVWALFQRAPTLGGECYGRRDGIFHGSTRSVFQRAPTLGGECYNSKTGGISPPTRRRRFNGHPPLGVNATRYGAFREAIYRATVVSTGTHPWG